MVGCGGRGTWIANLFQEHGGYEIVACADYFQDRVDSFGSKFNVPNTNRFTGLASYKRMLEKQMDAIAIESPPYFHPEQVEAGLQANVHVYLAKPIAVDVPGCLLIEKLGKWASENERCLLIDFQTRADPFYMEALQRVHDGALGEFTFGEAIYHAGSPWKKWFDPVRKDPDNPELRLRAWGMDRVLSGDIITEQNIHTLDVMSWIMDKAPLFAVGTGGLKGRAKLGTCYDHFACFYQYPNNIGITFSSRQFQGYGSVPEGIRNRMFGSDGVLETEYGGQVLIRGKSFYKGGRSPGIYKEGAQTNIARFHDEITKKIYTNTTVKPSVRSNLVTLLGRKAAYTGESVFWYQLVKDTERLKADLKGLLD
jgi:predicted dehydrogenase